MIEYLWCFYESNFLTDEEYYKSINTDKKIGELFTDRFTAIDVRNLLQKRSKRFIYVVRQSTKAD